MQRNEGIIDRVIRAVVGLILLGVGVFVFQATPIALWVLALLGLVLMVSGALGFCPLYRLFRFSTIPRQTYNRDAPPSRPWATANVDRDDNRIRSWGRSESRSARYRQDTAGRSAERKRIDSTRRSGAAEWGTSAEARAASNRTMYRSGSKKR
jgi:hypothetical protein